MAPRFSLGDVVRRYYKRELQTRSRIQCLELRDSAWPARVEQRQLEKLTGNSDSSDEYSAGERSGAGHREHASGRRLHRRSCAEKTTAPASAWLRGLSHSVSQHRAAKFGVLLALEGENALPRPSPSRYSERVLGRIRARDGTTPNDKPGVRSGAA